MDKLLIELRQQKKWSRDEAARRLGVANSTYRGWETGARVPADSLMQLSKVFGVSVATLLNQEDLKSEKLKKAAYYLEAALELVRESLV